MIPYPLVERWRESRPGLICRPYGITIWAKRGLSTCEAGSGLSWYDARRLFGLQSFVSCDMSRFP